MSSVAPFPVSTPHHFEIVENERGYWEAKDTEGLIGGVFRTEKDALRFALFEVGGDRTCVLVLAPKQSVAESCQGVAAAKIISELRCPTGYTGAEFQHQ